MAKAVHTKAQGKGTVDVAAGYCDAVRIPVADKDRNILRYL